ncbi:protein kinase [Candidatus Uabimicrobium sp. HlEnr_7]|uniref:protein kinase domain-containing protein n=1 Tax=Candidatus Uabimicrobium helgolandensis TaxID=3095367 RepID=UPI0035580474
MPNNYDLEMAQKAVSLGFIKPEHLQKGLQIQKQHPHSTLIQIFKKYNLLSPQQVQEIADMTNYDSVEKIAILEKVPPQSKMFLHYQIQKKLGQGGMGVVYKVFDTKLRRIVALKLMLNTAFSEEEAQRFMREASVTAQLDHPHIVKILEVGDQPNCFFTMEYIEGKTFKDLLYQETPEFKKYASILQKIASALHTVHAKNFIHRDIKPANIMIDSQGHPKLMDFGLVKVSQENSLTKTGNVLGTVLYMSPEQVNAEKIDKRSDIYSLGASLYASLVGRPPFQSENYINIVMQILSMDPVRPSVLNPDVPGELEAICLKCLEKDPNRRYHSAKALAKDLQNFIENRPVSAKPPSIWSVTYKFILRHRLAVFTGIAVYLLVVIGAIFSVVQWKSAEREKAQKTELARERALALAKISMTQAAENYHHKKWQECGALVGTALEYIKNIEGEDVVLLREKGKGYIRACLQDIGVLSQKYNYGSGLRYDTIHFSPDNQYVVTFSSYEENFLSLYHINGDKIMDLPGHIRDVNLIKFSANSKYLATVDENMIIVWNIPRGTEKWRLEKKGLLSIDFDPNDKFLVARSTKSISLWNIQDKSKVEELMVKGHGAAFLSQDEIVFAVDKDVFVRDIASQKTYQRFSVPETINELVVDHITGNIVTLAGDELVLWHKNKPRFKIKTKGQKLQISPTGIAFINKKQVVLYNLQGKKIWEYQFYNDVSHIDFAFSHQVLAICEGSRHIYLWDIANKRWLCSPGRPNARSKEVHYEDLSRNAPTLKIQDKTMRRISQYLPEDIAQISPDEKTLAIRNSWRITMWDIESGQEKYQLSYYDNISDYLFSPDNKWLIVATPYKIFVHNAKSGTLIKQIYQRPDRKSRINGGYNAIYKIDMTADSKILAVAKTQGVLLRDIANNYDIASLKNGDDLLYSSQVQFSRDGKKLAVSGSSQDTNVLVWDTATQKLLYRIPVSGQVLSIRYSIDGKVMAIGQFDAVSFFDVSTGKQLYKKVLNQTEKSLSYSPGDAIFHGKNQLLCTEQGRITIVDFSLQKSGFYFSGFTVFDCSDKFLVGSIESNRFFLSTTKSSIALFDIANLGNSIIVAGKSQSYLYGKNSFLPGNEKFVTYKGNKVFLWNTSGKKLFTYIEKNTAPISQVITHNNVLLISSGTKCSIVDILSGRQIAFLKKDTHVLPSEFAFAIDNSSAIVARDNDLYFWDYRKNKVEILQKTHSSYPTDITFSADGKHFLTASQGEVVLWRFKDKKILHKTVEHSQDSAVSTFFYPRGFASLSENLALFSNLKNYKVSNRFIVQKPMVSPDGHYLVQKDGEALLINSLQDNKTYKLDNIKPIKKQKFLANSKYLLCETADQTVIWDIKRQAPLRTIYKPEKGAEVAQLDSDDQTMLTNYLSDDKVSISQIAPLKARKAIHPLPLWTLNFVPQQKQKYIKNSILDYRLDIPGWLIEYNLEANPKLFTQYLFQKRVSPFQQVENFDLPSRLWKLE